MAKTHVVTSLMQHARNALQRAEDLSKLVMAQSAVDHEVVVDVARSACVVLHSALESAVIEVLAESCVARSGRDVSGFVSALLRERRRRGNMNSERLCELAARRSPRVGAAMKAFFSEKNEENKELLDGLCRDRNRIAHEVSASISLTTLRLMLKAIEAAVSRLQLESRTP